MKAMTKKIISALALAAAVTGAADAAWYEDVTFKGDLRYRYESIESGTPSLDRTRHRLRFRYGANGKVNDSISWGMRLATGSTTDPVSTNQTIGSGSADKNFNLDKAFVKVAFNESISTVIGKQSIPFSRVQKSQLLFDGDLTPEGISASFENGGLYANVAYLAVNSERRDQNSTTLRAEDEIWYGAQVGYEMNNFEIGVGYHLLTPSATAGLAFSQANGNDIGHDFEVLNIYGQYKFKLGTVKSALYFDYATNSGTVSTVANDDQDSAFAVGVNFKGKMWKAGVEYKEVEKNALYSEWSDSDFGGGGTDYDGLKFSAGYKFAKNSAVALTYFINDDTILPSATASDYKRLQADLKFKF